MLWLIHERESSLGSSEWKFIKTLQKNIFTEFLYLKVLKKRKMMKFEWILWFTYWLWWYYDIMKSFCVGNQKYVGITFKYEFFVRTSPMLKFDLCGKSKFFKKSVFPKSILGMSSSQDKFLR